MFGAGNEVSFNGTALYGLKRSGAEKKFLASMGAEKHSFDAVAFSTANFPKEEAVKFGKENAEKFIKYDLSVITVDDEQEAKALLKQINGNEITFADAASEKSQKYYSDAEGKMQELTATRLKICLTMWIHLQSLKNFRKMKSAQL